MSRPRGDLFVVSAPSGAGKTTLCRRLISMMPGIEFSVSYTTRAPRAGEADGVDYVFVDEAEFRRMADSGEFAEWAEVHGNLYGTSGRTLKETLAGGSDLLLDIDVQGARQLRERFPGGIYVFVLPPSMDALQERLGGRKTDSPEVVRRRLSRARDEIRDYEHYDYVIVNDDFERALGELEAIVTARRKGSGRVDREWVERNFLR
ncbi:MAG: guanylate kinase [Nitrospirota bacterium]